MCNLRVIFAQNVVAKGWFGDRKVSPPRDLTPLLKSLTGTPTPNSGPLWPWGVIPHRYYVAYFRSNGNGRHWDGPRMAHFWLRDLRFSQSDPKAPPGWLVQRPSSYLYSMNLYEFIATTFISNAFRRSIFVTVLELGNYYVCTVVCNLRSICPSICRFRCSG